MNNEIIQLSEQLVNAHLWKVIAIFIISFVLMGLIKHVATMVFEFVLLKTDIFGRGSLIYYGGKKAKIKKIGLRRTELYIIDKDETIIIRTSNWRKFELVDVNAKQVDN